MSAPRPTPLDLDAAQDLVTRRFPELFADSDDYLGRTGRTLRTAALTKISLRGFRRVGELMALVTLAESAGRHDVLLEAAEVLLAVPFTGDHDLYEPVRQTICGAVRRCELDGHDATAFRAAMLVERDEHGRPTVESTLKSRASGFLWKRMRETRNPDEGGRYGLLRETDGIEELYLAWALGGSLLFSRKKIDRHIAEHVERLRALDAIR